MKEPAVTLNILKVLAAVMRTPDEDVYALDLVRYSGVTIGSIYATLAQLGSHKLLTSHLEQIDPSQAGRPRRRYYRLTARGINYARTELLTAQRALNYGGEHV